jgi:hypothetical protein
MDVTIAEKYKEVCWIRKHSSPREMWRWFIHETSMALTLAHFCNISLQNCKQTNKNTGGQNPHNSVYTYLLEVYICLQNVDLVHRS